MLTAWTLGEGVWTLQIWIFLTTFNKTREIFPSVTRDLSILLTTSVQSVQSTLVQSTLDISASVERANFKDHVTSCLVTSNRKPKVSSLNPDAS